MRICLLIALPYFLLASLAHCQQWDRTSIFKCQHSVVFVPDHWASSLLTRDVITARRVNCSLVPRSNFSVQIVDPASISSRLNVFIRSGVVARRSYPLVLDHIDQATGTIIMAIPINQSNIQDVLVPGLIQIEVMSETSVQRPLFGSPIVLKIMKDGNARDIAVRIDCGSSHDVIQADSIIDCIISCKINSSWPITCADVTIESSIGIVYKSNASLMTSPERLVQIKLPQTPYRNQSVITPVLGSLKLNDQSVVVKYDRKSTTPERALKWTGFALSITALGLGTILSTIKSTQFHSMTSNFVQATPSSTILGMTINYSQFLVIIGQTGGIMPIFYRYFLAGFGWTLGMINVEFLNCGATSLREMLSAPLTMGASAMNLSSHSNNLPADYLAQVEQEHGGRWNYIPKDLRDSDWKSVELLPLLTGLELHDLFLNTIILSCFIECIIIGIGSILVLGLRIESIRNSIRRWSSIAQQFESDSDLTEFCIAKVAENSLRFIITMFYLLCFSAAIQIVLASHWFLSALAYVVLCCACSATIVLALIKVSALHVESKSLTSTLIWSAFYGDYNYERHYYFIVVHFIQFVTAVMIAILFDFPVLQISILAVLCITETAACMKMKPYLSETLNKFALALSICKSIHVYLALVFIGDQSDGNQLSTSFQDAIGIVSIAMSFIMYSVFILTYGKWFIVEFQTYYQGAAANVKGDEVVVDAAPTPFHSPDADKEAGMESSSHEAEHEDTNAEAENDVGIISDDDVEVTELNENQSTIAAD